MHLVSIIMPAYNSSKFISESIQSVIDQTYQNWELIIVDDCSTDDTFKVVSKFKDVRIKYIYLTSNSGSPALPRNTAIDVSKGKYLAFLDSDDLWLSSKLMIQVEFMIKHNIYFSCSAYEIMDEKNNGLSAFTPPLKVNYKNLLSNNSIGCLTAMLDRNLLAGMRFPLYGHEDYALWLKLIKKAGYVYGIPTCLAKYRKVFGSVSSDRIKVFTYFWHIYRNQEGFSFVVSLYWSFRYFINVMWFKYK